MKKIIKVFWLVIGLFSTITFTQANDYKYTNLDINADILIDWTINIKETYTADFFVNKHGIYRTIPVNYSVDWNKFHIDITNIHVEWKKYTTTRNNWKWTIKIWDANKYEYWKVIYPISYSVYWLIKNFSWMWYSELYRNIVWQEFDTNIEKVVATINLPQTYTWFKNSDFLITADWITKSVNDFKWTVDWSQWNKIVITYNKWLSAYQWITLAIKFPNNYFKFDDEKQAKLVWNAKIWIMWSIKSFISNINFQQNFEKIFWIWLFFIVIPLTIFWSYVEKKYKSKINLKRYNLKWKFAKQFKVIVQYAPPKWLNSAEVWLLLHRKAQIQDLFSLIYKRAAQWLIEINADIPTLKFNIQLIKNIKIKKLKEIPESSPQFEKTFFNSFFYKDEIEISHYNNKHFTDLENLKNHWIKNVWFEYKTGDKKYIILAGIIAFLFMFFIPIFWIIIAIIIVVVIWNVFKKNLKETEKGAELISHILWYRQFLAACDERQLKTFLSQDPLYFDKTLPYAVVFWIETEFLKKITPIMQEHNITPTRYIGDLKNIGYCITSTNSTWKQSVYTEHSWFDKWSSFWWWGWGFSSWWGWWGGWWGSR